jgi:transcriptional regulator with XRE-family HTH domain
MYETFATRLRRLRDAKGWTHILLAYAADVSPRAVLYWESGEKIPNAESVDKLSTALRCSMSYLWRGKEDPYAPQRNESDALTRK